MQKRFIPISSVCVIFLFHNKFQLHCSSSIYVAISEFILHFLYFLEDSTAANLVKLDFLANLSGSDTLQKIASLCLTLDFNIKGITSE